MASAAKAYEKLSLTRWVKILDRQHLIGQFDLLGAVQGGELALNRRVLQRRIRGDAYRLVEQQNATHIALDSLDLHGNARKLVVGRMPRVFGHGVGYEFVEPYTLFDGGIVYEMQCRHDAQFHAVRDLRAQIAGGRIQADERFF